MRVLRVLVVDDSATARSLVVSILASDATIEVIGEARDGVEAVEMCERLRPDLVTMDLQMPEMDGVQAIRQIMVAHATPIVVVASLESSDVTASMRALEAGALAVLVKSAGPGTPRFERDRRELLATVKAMAQVKLVRRWAAVPPYRVAPIPPRPSEILAVGLVASTGGPNALRSVLSALPSTFPPPIFVVQHIASGFAKGLAEWLATTTSRTVKPAVHGEPLAANTVYVAPDDRHLEASRDHLIVSKTAPVGGFRPSGSRLLSSLAATFGSKAIGVIMTGMGRDGVDGLRALRDAGGAVFAQDEESCDIFGMPGVALQTGVVETTTPLATIPQRLAELVGV